MDIWGSILALAAEQHQVIGRWQALDLGASPATFDRRVRDEGWTRRGRGLWVPPGAPETPWLRVSAAALAGGAHALVTGLAGLWAAGVNVRLPKPIRVVTPMARHARRELDPAEVRVIASRTLQPWQATSHRRVPAAVVPRCFLDMVVPPAQPKHVVTNAMVAAVQSGHTTLAELHRVAADAAGMPGRGVVIRTATELQATGADSPFSLRVHRRLLRDGFRPDPQPAVVPTLGRDLHPDVTFSPERVAIECDSMLAHSEQRDLAIDEKKNRSYREAGWEPIRIGWWEYNHMWGGFVADLRRLLARPL